MKMRITGLSASKPGAVSKAGKAYSRGQIHTMARLAPAFEDGGVEVGESGTSYDCDAEIVRRLAASAVVPFVAEVTVEAQIRFGKREEVVTDVRPVATVTAKA